MWPNHSLVKSTGVIFNPFSVHQPSGPPKGQYYMHKGWWCSSLIKYLPHLNPWVQSSTERLGGGNSRPVLVHWMLMWSQVCQPSLALQFKTNLCFSWLPFHVMEGKSRTMRVTINKILLKEKLNLKFNGFYLSKGKDAKICEQGIPPNSCFRELQPTLWSDTLKRNWSTGNNLVTM